MHSTLAADFVLNHARIGNGAINNYGTNLQLRDDFVYIRKVLNRKRRTEYCAPLKKLRKEHLTGEGVLARSWQLLSLLPMNVQRGTGEL